MLARATTRVSVLRGTTVDVFGDEADASTVHASGIPASLVEQTRVATTRDDPTPRVIRYTVGRVPASTDVTEDDRIKDEQTNEIYIVTAVSKNANPAMQQPLRLDLKRTT